MSRLKSQGGDITDRLLKVLALGGIVSPVIYAAVVLVLGYLRLGYDHVKQYMSELGETGAVNAQIMNVAGFQLLGLFMIGFACGLYTGITGLGSKIGALLVLIAGISLVLVGFFPCDPGCNNVSFTGFLHGITATIPAVAMPFASLVMGLALRFNPEWKSYWFYSFASGVLVVILSPLMFLATFEDFAGALQRISMGIGLLWMMVISAGLLRLSPEPEANT